MKTRLYYLCASMLHLSACSTETLYNTAKELAAYQCMSMPPSEADRCIQQMNKASFEEYQAQKNQGKSEAK